MDFRKIISGAVSLSCLCLSVSSSAFHSDALASANDIQPIFPNVTDASDSGVLPNEPGTVPNVPGTDIVYVLNGDHYEVWGCGTDAVNVTIESHIGGIPVTVIEERSFIDCNALTTITMPDTITEIKEYAFCCCESLSSVRFSEALTKIGSNAFQGCNSLTSVTLPDSLTTIEHGAFFDCANLITVKLPANLTQIGGQSFSYCPLSEIVIPGSLSRVDPACFSKCALTSVIISDGVEDLSTSAFSECVNLEEVVIPESVTEISSYCFSACTGLKSVIILNPDCNIKYDDSTFSNYSELKDNEFLYYFTGTIYGYSGSTAQKYAENYNYSFLALDGLAKGDANGDGEINPLDATKLLMHFSMVSMDGKGILTADQIRAADVNGDGEIDPIDATYILSYFSYISMGGTDSIEKFIG